ncbi:MAG: transcription elongation factor GreA [Anaerolineae bacterium]|jgi:transcription elongation factor GreA|nr:transcription elongation factor GreA [Chloroflexota bacterium]MBV6435374.1 Transcription elongation factor GreA [Anaerolineae bacterium]MDL1915659.1 transcription elongation factor GreA [Anaerolineae bacterium CFX4]OQY79758.1 MAG: transcription elongation factor GreA [Anaerolineae bacterium UTCFX5]MCO6445614.1 transcription elongation factor GreA [Anaerolineae bacterium]
MSDEVFLTAEGAEGLRRELEDLITLRRPELAQRLKEAVADGDLKENANYHDAKEQQSFMEGRIQYLQDVLRRAQIISNDGPSDVVRVGSTVTIQEAGADDDETYTIVGAAEANPSDGKLSAKSPIGAALLGHKRGSKITVETPGGTIVFKIKAIN